MRRLWATFFKEIRIALIVIAVALGSLLLIVLIVYGALHAFLYADPEYRAMVEFGRDFEQVTIGMEREDVEERLGSPDSSDNDFHLGQKDGFEDAYERAAQSGATYYLFWHKWVDTTFTIGFDANDKVVVAESGGT